MLSGKQQHPDRLVDASARTFVNVLVVRDAVWNTFCCFSCGLSCCSYGTMVSSTHLDCERRYHRRGSRDFVGGRGALRPRGRRPIGDRNDWIAAVSARNVLDTATGTSSSTARWLLTTTTLLQPVMTSNTIGTTCMYTYHCHRCIIIS